MWTDKVNWSTDGVPNLIYYSKFLRNANNEIPDTTTLSVLPTLMHTSKC